MGSGPAALAAAFDTSTATFRVAFTTGESLVLTPTTYTADTLEIDVDGNLSASQYALYVHTDVANTNGGGCAYFANAHASTTDTCVRIDNNGTGNALHITADADLAASKYALFVNHTAGTSARTAVYFLNHATATGWTVDINNADGAGTAIGLRITQNQNATGLNVTCQNTHTSADALEINSAQTSGTVIDVNATGTDSAAVVLQLTQDHAGATGGVLAIDNDGSGTSLDIDMDVGAGQDSVDATGLQIDVDNAATTAGDTTGIGFGGLYSANGTVYAIDMSSITATHMMFKFPDADVALAAAVEKTVAVDIGGTTYYIALYLPS